MMKKFINVFEDVFVELLRGVVFVYLEFFVDFENYVIMCVMFKV